MASPGPHRPWSESSPIRTDRTEPHDPHRVDGAMDGSPASEQQTWVATTSAPLCARRRARRSSWQVSRCPTSRTKTLPGKVIIDIYRDTPTRIRNVGGMLESAAAAEVEEHYARRAVGRPAGASRATCDDPLDTTNPYSACMRSRKGTSWTCSGGASRHDNPRRRGTLTLSFESEDDASGADNDTHPPRPRHRGREPAHRPQRQGRSVGVRHQRTQRRGVRRRNLLASDNAVTAATVRSPRTGWFEPRSPPTPARRAARQPVAASGTTCV
jgi:hypothetical protein